MTDKKMSFAELQRAMQVKKEKGKDVKYAFRSAEVIYDHFKSLETEWVVNTTDDLVEKAGRLFIEATATAKIDDEIHSAKAAAEVASVPVFNTQKGEIKQMSEPQWTGAVSSYARKYALQGLFAIGEKDVDELAGSFAEQIKRSPEASKELIFLQKAKNMNDKAKEIIKDAETKMKLSLEQFPDNAILKLGVNVKKEVG